jgi:hypothetical protein
MEAIESLGSTSKNFLAINLEVDTLHADDIADARRSWIPGNLEELKSGLSGPRPPCPSTFVAGKRVIECENWEPLGVGRSTQYLGA